MRGVPPGPAGAAEQEKEGEETGRVLHRYGTRVKIVEPQPGARGEVLKEIAPETRAQLSRTEQLGLAAFQLRTSAAYAQAKRQRPRQGQPWNFRPGGCALVPSAGAMRSLGGAMAGPTSAYMEGSVAVGLVIVGGPGQLQFSQSELEKVVAEAQNGLSFYAGTYPAAGLSFTYDIQIVDLSVPPDPNAGDLEAVWRDPALASLGYPGSWAGASQYIENLRQQLHTRWTYCAFLTKYPTSWFAYAYIGGPYLVMQYDNDGWGPDNIDRVFAHETGHIFTCPDEYAGACDCGGSWGRWGKPNDNCQTCAPGGGFPCIMKINDWTMCTLTPAHLGWMAARVVASHSRKSLDVAQASTQSGAPIIQYPYHGGENQLFRPDSLPGGWFRFVCQLSGKVLEVEGASTSNGARLVQADWNGGDNQQFAIEHLSDGNVRIIAKHSGKVLDVEGASTEDSARIIQYDWHGGPNQQFMMAAPIVASHSGKVLDVEGASASSGAHIVQFAYHGKADEIFRPEPVGGGYVRFVCQLSGKVLDVEGASKDNLAPLIQYEWKGADNQKFRLEPLGDGNVRIVVKHSGKVLDVQGGSIDDSAPVIQYDWHGGNNQRWLVPHW